MRTPPGTQLADYRHDLRQLRSARDRGLAIQGVRGVRSQTCTLESQSGQGLVRWTPGAEAQCSGSDSAIQEAGFSAEAVEPRERSKVSSLECLEAESGWARSALSH